MDGAKFQMTMKAIDIVFAGAEELFQALANH